MPKRNNAPVSVQASEASNVTSNLNILFPSPSTVKGRVLGAFLRGERLTHLDCWARFGSSRLSGHVHTLKRECGWPIQEVDKVVSTKDAGRKATIGVYFLSAEAIQQAGEQGQKYAVETTRINTQRRAA